MRTPLLLAVLAALFLGPVADGRRRPALGLRRHVHRQEEQGHLPRRVRPGDRQARHAGAGRRGRRARRSWPSPRTASTCSASARSTTSRGRRPAGWPASPSTPRTGELKPINQESSVGAGPCHLVCDKAGKNVLVANYGGGSVAVLPVGAGRQAGPASAFVQHTGSGADKGRQEGPHAHSVNLDAANKFAVVADLGLDKVLVYRFDPAAREDHPERPAGRRTGPRLRPAALGLPPERQVRLRLQRNDLHAHRPGLRRRARASSRCSTRSPRCRRRRKGNSTAETVVHPNGKFVYVSNRGHNSIAIFAIDPATGRDQGGRPPGRRDQDPAELQHRPDRQVDGGRQPGRGQPDRVRDRPGDRGAQADRPEGRGRLRRCV